MNRYTCILFDLDHTLWDFETNSADTLRDLYHRFSLAQYGAPAIELFLHEFKKVNTALWEAHDRGTMTREVIRQQRFHRVFSACGMGPVPFTEAFSDAYMAESPAKKNLMPNAWATLQYLHSRYPLFIITNGFNDVQHIKAHSSGIAHFFKKIVTSECVGSKKPSRQIFDYVLTRYGFRPSETMMVGDNLETDMRGAKNAGITATFYNPHSVPHQHRVQHEITDLHQLQAIL
jgi:putative hydrolase of the HAD superfamily